MNPCRTFKIEIEHTSKQTCTVYASSREQAEELVRLNRVDRGECCEPYDHDTKILAIREIESHG